MRRIVFGLIALAIIGLIGMFTIGLPLGTKTATAQSGNLNFEYTASQRLRFTANGPQLAMDLHSLELLPFLYSEFSNAKIHRKIRDQQITSLTFVDAETARVEGKAVIRLNKYVKIKARFHADIKIGHEDRALLVTYDLDIKDFPDKFERAFTRRIPMDKRLRRDCMTIDAVAFVPGSEHTIQVAASCGWGQIF